MNHSMSDSELFEVLHAVVTPDVDRLVCVELSDGFYKILRRISPAQSSVRRYGVKAVTHLYNLQYETEVQLQHITPPQR